MYADQQTYRDLYDAVVDYEGGDVHADVVRPWLRGQDGERRWLEAFAKRTGSPIPAATAEESCRLYALSRVSQRLLDSPGYAEFMESLGLTRINAGAFHPFTHEIVAVDVIERGGPSLIEEYWAGYMLGPLLIARAGCRVAAGAEAMDKEIAERSTLYWAVVRPNRPTNDLSHGWGNNSLWRTSFRRDYELDGIRYYNVDAKPSGGDAADDLDESERLELLRYRSFVKCAKPHEDRFPYNDSHREESFEIEPRSRLDIQPR